MRRHLPPLALALAALLTAAGCATSGPSRPLAEFPSPAALAAIESAPVTPPNPQFAPIPTDGWTVAAASAAPASADVWRMTGPADRFFLASFTAARRNARLTRAMGCVAEQFGRFSLQHPGTAPDPVRQFVVAACGVVLPHVGFQALTSTVNGQVSDEEVAMHYANQLSGDVLAHVPADASELGFWAGQSNGKWIAMIAYGSGPVELQPFTLVADAAGYVTVEGRFLGEVRHFEALVNQGRFGVAPCLLDPAVPRPQFRASCHLAKDDDSAWFEISYVLPKRMLANPLVQGLARRDASQPLRFDGSGGEPAVVVGTGAAFRQAVLARLNGVRAEAGLRPLRLETAQSDGAERMVGQYFAAAHDQRHEDTDTIALGMLAGWQVTGTIRDGAFFSGVIPGSGDSGQWLRWALTTPMGRRALLARDSDALALGSTFFHQPDGVAVMAASYRLQQGNDHSADVQLLYRRIAEARQRHNLPAPVRLGGVDAVIGDELVRVARGEQNVGDALQASLEGAVRKFNRDMRGLVIEVMSVEDMEIPQELLSQASLVLELGVAHYKPPGAAWAQLVIILVYTAAGGVPT